MSSGVIASATAGGLAGLLALATSVFLVVYLVIVAATKSAADGFVWAGAVAVLSAYAAILLLALLTAAFAASSLARPERGAEQLGRDGGLAHFRERYGVGRRNPA